MGRIIINLEANQVTSVETEGVYHINPRVWDMAELFTDRALAAARAADLNKPLPLKVEVPEDVRKPESKPAAK